MTDIGGGLYDWLLLLIVILVFHESWRWAGLFLGRGVKTDSELFQWVQCVATAIVAALVMRLVLFPAGVLADVSIHARLAALAIGAVVYVASGNRLAVGVAAGTGALVVLHLAFKIV